MKSECRLKNEIPVRQCMKNETKCMICENTVFKVRRITSQQIILTCENCRESHMIGMNSNQSSRHLTFWNQETGIED